MKILKAWFAFALLSGAALALADPPAQVGRLNYLSGAVSFAPAESNNDWSVAPLNRPVTTGDRLWSDRDGRAEMRIGSTAIRIHALTSMDVLRLDDEITHLRLAQGTLNVHLRHLDAGDSFEISTPGGAVLLTQPGSYRVNVDASGGTTTVLVRRGQADVLTISAPLVVRDNQLLALSAQGQETLSAPAPDEFDNWAAARDRLEERVAATRYVPPAMTGYEDLDQHGTWQETPQYGAVWMPTAVATGWAPYRDGRWVWISPWGWTWVDSAPWGFAPYHYGRWVWLGHRWAWTPGARVARPVYAPALVAFVGGSNWSVSAGPAVGWVPLGWREPYIPWYRHSPAYARNVNVTHVTNINIIQHYGNVNNVTRIRYINRDVPSATTVVTRETFVSARRVHEAQLHVPAHTLAAARVAHDAPVLRPERHSFAPARPGARLPEAIASREVVAARAPLTAARFANDGTTGNARGGSDERPRVRVLGAPQAAQAPLLQSAPVAPAPQPAVRADRPDRAADRNAPVVPARPAADQPPQIAPRPGDVAAQQRALDAQQQRERQLQQAQQDQQQQARAQERLAQQQKQQEQKVHQQQAERQRAHDAQQQRERQLQQAQQEQQQQARAQAKLAQQQKLQEQKDRQHQVSQQRTHEVQQQRERQFQQAQQVQQQQQLRQQQVREQRQAERTEQQRQASVRALQPPAPSAAPSAPVRDRRTHDAQGPNQR